MQLEDMKALSVPFGTYWYRCASCKLGKRKGEWVFYFSGKVTPYEVGFETYLDFRSLKLPQILEDTPPGDDVLEFLQKYGPLGIYYKDLNEPYIEPSKTVRLYLPVTEGAPGADAMEDFWMRYHTRKCSAKKLLRRPPSGLVSEMLAYRPDSVFNNYFERWRYVWHELVDAQDLFEFIEDPSTDPYPMEGSSAIDFFNGLSETSSLRPRLIQTGDKKYEWSFGFNNLSDALIGLHGQVMIGKVRMEECPVCHTRFDAIRTKRRRFCSDTCSVQYGNKRMLSDPLTKEKRKLQERARRRVVEIGEEKADIIKREISKAKNQKDLRAIEKKYGAILEARKPWGSPENTT
jgi:hypothetical protein